METPSISKVLKSNNVQIFSQRGVKLGDTNGSVKFGAILKSSIRLRLYSIQI